MCPSNSNTIREFEHQPVPIPAVSNPDWDDLKQRICFALIRESEFSEEDAIEFSCELVDTIHDWIMQSSYHTILANRPVNQATR